MNKKYLIIALGGIALVLLLGIFSTVGTSETIHFVFKSGNSFLKNCEYYYFNKFI